MAFENFNKNFEFDTCEHFASVKLFGMTESEVEQILLPNLSQISENVLVEIVGNRYDILIKIGSNGEKKIFDECLKSVYKLFSEFIYADENIKLEQRLIDCMVLFSQNLVIFEQETNGVLTGKIARIKGSNHCVLQSIVVPDINNVINLPMCKNFETDKIEDLAKNIAESMLQNRDNTMSVCCLRDEEQIIIALADNEKTSLFWHDYDQQDENYLEDITNTILFYLVKKSGQNDLKFL